MQETFRLGKHVRLLGTAYVAIYVLACLAYGSLLLIDEPFGDGRSGFPVGVMGLCVFGPMLVMSCFYLASYYAEQFSIDGDKLAVRSILQNRQFSIADIESLRWTTTPSSGVRLRVRGMNVRLNVSGYGKADRLRIIRILRGIVPAEVQIGWPMFCHKVAIPLRDGKPSITRVEPSPSSFHVTRRRYNRAMIVALPASVIVAVLLANRFQMKEFLALPGLVAVAILFLRSSTPKDGRTEFTFQSRWRKRAAVFGAVGILGSISAMFGSKLFDFESTPWNYLPIGIALASFPPLLICLMKADKERLKADELAADGAAAAWLDGEQIEWTGESG
jgi:hypothetical protein